MNNRLNINGNFNANAVWQIHIDLLLKYRSRLSFNYLFDEFVIDPDIEIGKEHGKAFSLRYSIPVYVQDKNILNIFFSHIRVGTPTFRHGLGTNNFVNKNSPLGWENGSDAIGSNIGLSYLKKNSFGLDLVIGELQTGRRKY